MKGTAAFVIDAGPLQAYSFASDYGNDVFGKYLVYDVFRYHLRGVSGGTFPLWEIPPRWL